MKLNVEHLDFCYQKDLPVLQDISFQADSREFISFLGPNGVGKSTLFRCILGNLRQYSGSICINGEDTRSMSPRTMAQHIAYIPQTHRPTFGYTVEDTVLMGTTRQLAAFAQPGEEQLAIARRAIEQVGISHLSKRNFAELSGGEQQLTLIARAIAQQPSIFVMDEPTSALDFGNQLRILQQVKQLTAAGYTVLLSTHNPQHALQFATRTICLLDGKVLTDDVPAKAVTTEVVHKLYRIHASFLDTENGRVIIPNIQNERKEGIL